MAAFTKIYALPETADLFNTAVATWPLMAEHGIAPVLLNIDEESGIIKSERMVNHNDPEYKQFVRLYPGLYRDIVNTKIDKLKALGFCHGDMCVMNVVLRFDPVDPPEALFIDWDFAFSLSSQTDKLEEKADFYETTVDELGDLDRRAFEDSFEVWCKRWSVTPPNLPK
jgi:tRNA A-37 threonylcarbamoyl transferase component Bud32